MESHLPLRGTNIMGVIIGTELLGAERGMILDEAAVTNDADTFRHRWVSIIQSILNP